MNNRMVRLHTNNSATKIWWVEKLVQTPINNYRKFALWRILGPYTTNIRGLSGDEANDTILRWPGMPLCDI
ncbi:MAG: hypothetical protein WBQ25_21780 [Nitrososphaeraceae archaeon]